METSNRAVKIYLMIGLLITSIPSFSQIISKEINKETTYLYLFVEKLPEFPGGHKAFDLFVEKNIIWPDKGMDAQGSVLLSFIVTKKGDIIDVRIERSLNKVFDKEAKRIIALMPKWVPGEINNKRINTRLYLPINFFLTNPPG